VIGDSPTSAAAGKARVLLDKLDHSGVAATNAAKP
jgi:hypothetical protein